MAKDIRVRLAALETAVQELQVQLLKDTSTPIAPPAVTSGRVKVEDALDEKTAAALRANGIEYMDELERKSDEQLLALDDIGPARVKSIRSAQAKKAGG